MHFQLTNLSVISNNNATGQPYQGGQQDPPQDNQGQQKVLIDVKAYEYIYKSKQLDYQTFQ